MQIRLRSWIVRSLVLLSCACAPWPSHKADQAQQQLRTRLDHDLPLLLAEHKIPSVSIAHIERGHITLLAAYGQQSAGVAATPATLYNVASLTKPISAEVILRLASSGALTLDEPMYRYWLDPDLAQDERVRQLTLRLALSHQSGLPNWRYQTGGTLVFKNTPGTAYGYSGEGYEYAARFTEKKLGSAFETLARQWVLEPLGMHDTAYTRKPWFDGRIAVPTDAAGVALQPHVASHYLASDLLYSTPGDYAKFMLSLMRDEALSPAIAAERGRVQLNRRDQTCRGLDAAQCPDETGMGLGWELFRFGQQRYFMHTGSDDGVFTLAYFSPTSRRGTVIFSNSANGPKLVLPILERIGSDADFVALLRSQAG